MKTFTVHGSFEIEVNKIVTNMKTYTYKKYLIRFCSFDVSISAFRDEISLVYMSFPCVLIKMEITFKVATFGGSLPSGGRQVIFVTLR